MSAFTAKVICCGVGSVGIAGAGIYAVVKYSGKSTVSIREYLEKELKLRLISSV